MKSFHSCPICNSNNISLNYEGFTGRKPQENRIWKVYRCDTCTHAFINPQPTWDELAAYYTSNYEAYDPNHGSEEFDDAKIITSAEQHGEFRHLPIPKNKKLLDVGCGGGWFLRISKKLGAHVQGIEPSDAGTICTRNSGIDVFQGTLEDYLAASNNEIRKADFDVITANHVIEHTPSPTTTLKHMSTLLAPGGTIWISVPNAACYFSHKLGSHWHSTDLPYHLQLFSPRSMAEAGKLAGLTIHRQYTYSLPSATASSLRTYLRRKFLIPHRITSKIKLIENNLAPWLARHFDNRGYGEAIITEFKVA